jgi:hypothetical protein
MTEFKTMKEIGVPLGLTSHQVGKRLKALGLRTRDGRPSQQAFQRKLVAQKFAPDGQNYLWAWRADVISRLLTETTPLDGRQTPPSAGF